MTADIKTAIANEAVRIVTGARRAAYGTPESNFARIARLWNMHLANIAIFDGWTMADVERKGLQPRDITAMMRLMKEARLAETPDHLDSYVDLVGYALCGAEVAGVDGSSLQGAAQDSTEALGTWLTKSGEEIAPAPLQIKAGRFYRTRGGEVVGPILDRGERFTHAPWHDGLVIWFPDGSYSSDGPSDRDLIAEYVA